MLDLKTCFFTRRGIVKAVDGVSFSVNQGETIGLVGESGSGKSVCCLSIIRLVPEQAGRIVEGKILFDGEDLVIKSEREMERIRGRKIAMIYQDPLTSLNPVLSIGRQMLETLRAHQTLTKKNARERAKELLKLVGIPSPEERMRAYPHNLSGGMRQRVAGAMSLSCEPKLLIADEPTTSLDVTTQAQYLELLRQLRNEFRIGMIFVTHDFGIAASMCHRLLVFYAGRVVESGESRAVFHNPLHPYTIALLHSLPRLEEDIQRLPSVGGEPPNPLTLPSGCRFAPRCLQASDICKRQYPEEIRVGDDHLVSCWLRT